MPTMETIARLTTEMVSTGADKVASDLHKVEAAQDAAASSGEALATVTDTVARRQLSGATALERVRKAVDDEYRAQQRLVQVQQVLDRNLQQGNVTQEEHARLLSLAATRYTVAKQANDNFVSSAASGSKLAAHEAQNMLAQFIDAGTMLGSGSSPFQVMATQGGQVYQVLAGAQGGLVGGLRALTGTIAGLITPAVAATGSLLAMAAAGGLAWKSWAAGQQQIRQALTGIGAASGSTVESINAIVAATSRVGQGTVGDLRDFSTALAATGRVGDDINAKFTGLSHDLTKVLGGDATAAAQMFAAALADPAKGVEDLNAKFGAFNAATVRQVQSLMAQNRTMEAQQLLYEGVKRSLAGGADLTSSWSKAWDQAAAAASRYWAAAGRTLDRATGNIPLEEQKAELEAQLKSMEEAQAAAARRSGKSEEEFKAAIAALKSTGASDYQIAAMYPGYARDEEAFNRVRAALERVNAALGTAAAKSKEVQENLASLKAMGEIRIVMPEIDAAKALSDRAAYLDSIRNDPKLLAAAGYTKEQADLAAERAKEASASFLSDQQRAMRQAQLAAQAATARSPGERGAVAGEQAKLDLAGANVSPEEKAARIEAARANAAREANVALTDAARERMRAAQDAIGATQAEIAGIGRTAAEAELLRLNWQTYATLRAEAEQNHTRIDQAELERLKALNAERVRQNELLRQTQLLDDLNFERDQMGRSSVDQTVAARLRAAGQPMDMNGATAAQIRFNEQLKTSRDLAYDFASGFASDMRRGTDAVTALGNALGRFADKLADMAVNDLVNSAFGGLTKSGGGGGNIFTSIASLIGGPAWSGANMTGIGGFATGGFTGAGGKYEPAGVVHRGEYVFSADATSRLGVGRLESLHRLGRGYADGGYVGAAAYMAPWAAQQANVPMPAVTIGGPTITINGNADSAALGQMRAELEAYKKQMPALVGQAWETLNRNKRS